MVPGMGDHLEPPRSWSDLFATWAGSSRSIDLQLHGEEMFTEVIDPKGWDPFHQGEIDWWPRVEFRLRLEVTREQGYKALSYLNPTRPGFAATARLLWRVREDRELCAA